MNELMSWNNRMKVAIGAARGLRYLHEDCRVGCIVHRDFRPSNILLTHDFEPMVSLYFGLSPFSSTSFYFFIDRNCTFELMVNFNQFY